MTKKNHESTIIKRASRKMEHSAHGGAWKVAFADFTLAMMALFMTLWLVAAVSTDERTETMAQLRGMSIFDNLSFTPVSISKKGSNDSVIDKPSPVTMNSTTQDQVKDTEADPTHPDEDEASIIHQDESLVSVLERSDKELQQLYMMLKKVSENFDTQANLSFEAIPQGLRILIQDDKNRTMFQRGSASLTPYFEKLLTGLAPVFNSIENKMIISGHTDAAKYGTGSVYNNWNLSGDRALAARRALERGGLDSSKVIQVNAMASNMLLDKKDPMDDSNRRIEIMVLTDAAADTLYQYFGHHGEKIVEPVAKSIK